MSSVDRLVRELCPGGVEYVPLGEIAELKRGTSISKKDIEPGEIPVVAGGITPAYFTNQSNREGPVIVVAGSGSAGFVSYWEEPIFVSDAFSIHPHKAMAATRYIYHALKSKQEQIYALKRGGGVPHVYAKDAAQILIPLPPLEVQDEIVRILEFFTQLDRELEAEIIRREAQLDEARLTLLSPSAMAEDKELGSFASISTGDAMSKKKIDANPGQFPVINSGQEPMGFISMWNCDTVPIGITSRGANVGHVSWTDGKFFRGPLNYGIDIKESDQANTRFIFHSLVAQQGQIHQLCTFQGIPALNKSNLTTLQISLPPLEVQREIAATLDAFTEYIDNLKRERELRQKQYEHYRDQLLNFPVKA